MLAAAAPLAAPVRATSVWPQAPHSAALTFVLQVKHAREAQSAVTRVLRSVVLAVVPRAMFVSTTSVCLLEAVLVVQQ